MRVLMATMKMDIGGAETHILEAAKALAAKGVSVTVVSGGGVYADALRKSGIAHIEAPLYTKRPDCVWKAYAILKKLIKSGEYDVVHAHARIPAVLCHALCRRYHVRFVTTAHLTFVVNGLWRRLMHWGSRTLAVSDDIKEYLIREYGACADNIAVTINGINTETFSPYIDPTSVINELGLTPACRRIVHVSRMDVGRSEAGVQLASIAPRLCEIEPTLEILIVGDGDDFARLQAAAEKSNAEIGRKAVKLAGARTDINRLIAVGDFFVGVSRAALEAMAMAKPTVVAGDEGYLGIYTKNKFEVAYDTNFCCRGQALCTPDALFADIKTLLTSDKETLEALGRDGLETVKEQYSIARMARDYLWLYEGVRPYRHFKYGDILICGYYGFRNMGDDSLLRAIIENLRKYDADARITVMSRSPKETTELYGTNAIDRFDPISVIRAMKHARLLIFGGGNLLQDGSSTRSLHYYTWILRLARHMGLKIMVYANGIGPLHNEKNRAVAKNALLCADLLTLREKDSYGLCRELGIPEKKLRLTADPAFSLKEADRAWVMRRLGGIGVTAGARYFIVALRKWKENEREKAAQMAQICDRIAKDYGCIPVFLPMHDPLDEEVNRLCASLCTTETRFLTQITGSELLGILRHMEFVIAMRLHTLIYSTAVGIPSIGLAYDGKLRAFMETMELPYMVDEPEETALMACVDAVIANKDEISMALCARHDALCALAANDAREALSLASEATETGEDAC